MRENGNHLGERASSRKAQHKVATQLDIEKPDAQNGRLTHTTRTVVLQYDTKQVLVCQISS